jgi:hypothetical protein
MMIINPGSENKGGTYAQAVINAEEWHNRILEEFPEVEMSEGELAEEDGNWIFYFRHKITGKSAMLEIHGYTESECEKFLFRPRIYWNGSSTDDPSIEDWLTDEFTYKITFIKKQ